MPSRRNRRLRSVQLETMSVAPLDDLLRFEEGATELPTVRPPQPWVVRSALQAFIASAVVYTLLHVFSYGPPYPLIAAVCAGAVLVRRAVKMVAEPNWLRARDAIGAPRGARRIESSGWYEGGDGMLAAVHRWDRRLDWGTTGWDRFDHTVTGRLADLADERLRQRHGLTLATDPARARALLGERAWALVTGSTGRVPTPAELAATIDRLSTL